MVFAKIKKYGLLNSFYRLAHRIASKIDFHPNYLFRKFFFGYAIKEVNGVKMWLDLKNDEGISKFLMIHGKREPLSVDYLLESGILKEGSVALDIGANIGYYALLESRLVGSTGKVYALEPVLNNFRLLNKNIELNGLGNISVYNMAVGDKDNEKVEIYMRSKGNLSSLTELPDDYGNVVAKEKVMMATVDGIVKTKIGRAPDFVRMDVEGYELSILEGMINTMKSKPCLQIEFHPMLLSKEQKDRIYELLKENYSKATITSNPKPKANFIVRLINKKIAENYIEGGSVEECDIKGLHKMLFSADRVFNAFIR